MCHYYIRHINNRYESADWFYCRISNANFVHKSFLTQKKLATFSVAFVDLLLDCSFSRLETELVNIEE